MSTPLELRTKLIIAKQEYGQGNLTTDELYAIADEYIESLKVYKKTKNKKLAIPSRAYLIRAL